MISNDKYRILVAEDNSINIQVARYILSPLASELDFVLNGEEVIEKYLKNQYDLILMDVVMPVMDGYEATQKIRKIELIRGDGIKIPIIAMTANNMYEEIQNCLNIGMDGFLSKPFNTTDVKEILKTLQLRSANHII
jgi:CheY-like chemotaxis protein